MLKFRLVEETHEKAIYEYFPEGGSEFGKVSFDKQTKTNSIITLSANDKHQRYVHKLFGQIREFANKNSFEKEGMIAWY